MGDYDYQGRPVEELFPPLSEEEKIEKAAKEWAIMDNRDGFDYLNEKTKEGYRYRVKVISKILKGEERF